MIRLVWFDVTQGMPIALRTLKRMLGWRQTLRIVVRFLWRSLGKDPFAPLGKGKGKGNLSPAERFTRHQLKPVLLLDEVMRRDMPETEVMRVLGEVVAQSGARFIHSNVKDVDQNGWQTLERGAKHTILRTILGKFLNAEAEILEVPGAELAFDVTHCHFASLTRQLGRPALASLFCEADRAFFADPGLPLGLLREHTIANGDARCEFRFVSKGGRGGT